MLHGAHASATLLQCEVRTHSRHGFARCRPGHYSWMVWPSGSEHMLPHADTLAPTCTYADRSRCLLACCPVLGRCTLTQQALRCVTCPTRCTPHTMPDDLLLNFGLLDARKQGAASTRYWTHRSDDGPQLTSTLHAAAARVASEALLAHNSNTAAVAGGMTNSCKCATKSSLYHVQPHAPNVKDSILSNAPHSAPVAMPAPSSWNALSYRNYTRMRSSASTC